MWNLLSRECLKLGALVVALPLVQENQGNQGM
jgi:hypothetical protein